MPLSNKEKQASFRLRMAEAGYKRKEFWVTDEEADLLTGYLTGIRKVNDAVSVVLDDVDVYIETTACHLPIPLEGESTDDMLKRLGLG